MQALRRAAAKLLEQMAPELRQDARGRAAAQAADTKVYNIITYLSRPELRGRSKDYEFSRRTMEEQLEDRLQRHGAHLASIRGLQRPKAPMAFSPSTSSNKVANRRSDVKLADVRKNAFAMPLNDPSYPKGPYKFYNREFVVITYRTDPERLRSIVPEPLEVVGDT